MSGAFQLVELAVVPHARGHGIGGRLHDELLYGLTEKRAWLVTRPEAVAALGLYRSRGWWESATFMPRNGTGRRIVMNRDL